MKSQNIRFAGAIVLLLAVFFVYTSATSHSAMAPSASSAIAIAQANSDVQDCINRHGMLGGWKLEAGANEMLALCDGNSKMWEVSFWAGPICKPGGFCPAFPTIQLCTAIVDCDNNVTITYCR